ncbi:MAG TPA: redoxin domain-containing protein [Ktedonobacterales bacterium]|nr:redoxin domain-containing protein [Ktedonobacterales bacterium]
MKLKPGQVAPDFRVRDISGQPISLSAYHGRKVLLWFARPAACPLCNVRLWYLIRRYPEYQRQGLSVITFFESSDQVAHQYLDRQQAPFPIVADRQGLIYSLYGLKTSWMGVLRARLTRGSVYREAEEKGVGVWRTLANVLALDGPIARMPADFLIRPDQRVHQAYYARDAGDFLLFSELEAFLAA